MNSLSRDKLLAVLGSGLLGYYMSNSFLNRLIWDGILLKVLPPINERHLPRAYPGLLGAVIALALGYLCFSFFVEKKPLGKCRKEYFCCLTLAVALSLLVCLVFRVHSLSWVNKAESSTPTEITLQLNKQGSKLMFQTSPSEATGVDKSLNVEPNLLADLGQKISSMDLKEVVPNDRFRMEPTVTLFIDYRVDGHWYSKILNYADGLFSENVTGNRIAFYESEELAQTLEKLLVQAGKIEYYDSAKIMNWEVVKKNRPEVSLTPEQFVQLTSLIREENKVTPSTDLQTGYQELLDKCVKADDRAIYCFQLLKENPNGKASNNFILYDDANKLMLFENDYYRADLSNLIAEVSL